MNRPGLYTMRVDSVLLAIATTRVFGSYKTATIKVSGGLRPVKGDMDPASYLDLGQDVSGKRKVGCCWSGGICTTEGGEGWDCKLALTVGEELEAVATITCELPYPTEPTVEKEIGPWKIRQKAADAFYATHAALSQLGRFGDSAYVIPNWHEAEPEPELFGGSK